MGGGGSKSKSTSVSGSAQQWAQPYATSGASAVQGVFNRNQPGLQKLTDTVNTQIFPELVNRFQQGGENVAAARGNIADILSGKYLNNSPYLQQIINATNRDVTNGVNSQFEAAGRYGPNAAHTQVLAKQLADNENQLRYADYNNQLQRMDQASTLGLQSGLSDVAQALAAAGQGAQIPFAGSANLSNSLGALFNGGTSTSTSKQSGGGLFGALGAVGAGLASNPAFIPALSDRRAKTNITLLGREADGLGWYRFAYKDDPETMRVGVMADEVKELRPHAYIPNFAGDYAGVDYAAL